MLMQSKLDKALKLIEKEKYADAVILYKKILKSDSHSFEAIKHLAYCYYKQKRIGESIHKYLLAIKCNPNDAEVRNNLGYLYLLETKEYDKAYQQFIQAVKLSPNASINHHNLGNSLRQLHQYDEANVSYRNAIRINDKNAIYHDSLGYTLSRVGLFEEAITEFQSAHNLNKQLNSVYIHLFNLLMIMQSTEEALAIATGFISGGFLTKHEELEIRIGCAKLFWLLGDYHSLNIYLQSSIEIFEQDRSLPNINNLCVFHQYLSTLLTLRLANPSIYMNEGSSKTLLMISESHGFSPSGTNIKYQGEEHGIVSFLIEGGKMWNFSQGKNNIYKESLKRFFQNVPENCTIIMGFGEIDSRVNSGFFFNQLKKGIDYNKTIPEVTRKYIKNTYDTAQQYGHTLIFYGIPAPHPDMFSTLSSSQKIDYLAMVKNINLHISNACKKYSCSFLDVYQLTAGVNGESNLEYHIDNIHLHPRTFKILFEQQLHINTSQKNTVKLDTLSA
jgi:tetratricopeptide (TPR) repeat protein